MKERQRINSQTSRPVYNALAARVYENDYIYTRIYVVVLSMSSLKELNWPLRYDTPPPFYIFPVISVAMRLMALVPLARGEHSDCCAPLQALFAKIRSAHSHARSACCRSRPPDMLSAQHASTRLHTWR